MKRFLKKIIYPFYLAGIALIILPAVLVKYVVYNLERAYKSNRIMTEKIIYMILCVALFAVYMYWLFSAKSINPMIPAEIAFTLLAACFIAFIALIAWLVFFEEIQEWKKRKC